MRGVEIMIVGVMLGLVGCGGSRDPTAAIQPAVSSATPSCPASATSCPSECQPVDGIPIMPEKGCKGVLTTIGCSADGTTTDSVCARRAADGALFFLPSSAIHAPEWVRCDADQAAAATQASAALCAS